MPHLKINLSEDRGSYKLASYEIYKTAFIACAQKLKKEQETNPHVSIKNYLCSWYCFDPRITPEDIIDFKIMTTEDPSMLLIHLHLEKDHAIERNRDLS